MPLHPLLLALAVAALVHPRALGKSPTASQSSQAAGKSTPDSPAGLPRGKKLILKDGSFQLVREYQVQGERVRYFSTDTQQWEELPAALVDWAATHKREEQEARQDAALVNKVHTTETAQNAEMKLDVDASVEAAPGVFLPPGEGLFAFDGKAVLPLSQAQAGSSLNKKRLLEQVLIPIPVVPSRHTISLPGTRARFRVHNGQPEFYMRTADGREPEMVLIRAQVRRDDRVIENVDTIFKHQEETRDELTMQRWQIARGLYRFTLGVPLPPGEYAFAEIVQGEGMNLYVWDFGVNADSSPPATKPK